MRAGIVIEPSEAMALWSRHGLSGYTERGCNCKICRGSYAASRKHGYARTAAQKRYGLETK
jgi:hypothetical protein